ncbi:MAG: prolyl oligopeptidase family serine peptidase [Clostridia bacterium]|nr:prolyl oligopeptidase family serine peptidase [Clostridia bacterium]
MEEKNFEGLTYLVSYPEGFSEEKKYPLLVFLHGVGARIPSTTKLHKYPSLHYITARQNERGFVLIAPHCPAGNWMEYMAPLIRFVDHFRNLSFVDQKRVYLTGNSMGGYGTWALAGLRQKWFASAMPLCGGGTPGLAKEIGNLPIRAFHGLSDQRVDPIESLQMAKAVNVCGGHAELILLPSLPHNIWRAVYDNDENYDWLFSFTNERESVSDNGNGESIIK